MSASEDDAMLGAPAIAGAIRRAALDLATPFAPPRDATERALCRMMARAVGIDRVGIDDDFFALGGGSIEAARLFAAIEEEFTRRFPLALLYERASVRALAGLLAAGAEDGIWRRLIAVRKEGGLSPVFAVPGVGGEALGFELLAQHLPPGRPVHSCQPIGLDGVEAPLSSIDEISATYLAEIRRTRPQGPYYLLGACFGGLVALEMARRLAAEGEQIPLLVLIDAPLYAPGAAEATRGAPALPTRAGFVLDRLRLYARTAAALDGEARRALVREKVRLAFELICDPGRLWRDTLEQRRSRVIAANRHAARTYRPEPYGGRTLVVASGARTDAEARLRRRRWGDYLVGPSRRVEIASRTSGEMLAEPSVRELARIIADELALTDGLAVSELRGASS